MATEDIFQFSDSNFQNVVLKSKIPVLVEFWTPDGGPCRAFAPVFEELSTEYKGKVLFGKVNAYECPGLCAEFRITSVPTILLLEEGITQSKFIGLRSAEAIRDMINKFFTKKEEAKVDEQ